MNSQGEIRSTDTRHKPYPSASRSQMMRRDQRATQGMQVLSLLVGHEVAAPVTRMAAPERAATVTQVSATTAVTQARVYYFGQRLEVTSCQGGRQAVVM